MFHTKNSALLQHSAFMYFVQVSQQSDIFTIQQSQTISLSNEVHCVLCKVQTESLNIMQINSIFQRI